jgi:tetratricopeptide (TPR) repeat protein
MTRRTVMISSTAHDLPEHREQIRLACERAGFAPHDMMEHLPALNADAIDASLKMVAGADVYLGIFAYRYGYVPDGHEVSITEMEYDRAVELNKPRLIFFIHEDHPVTGRDFETGKGATKLQILKDRIGKARVAAFFRSPEDLRAHVIEALTTFSKELDTEKPTDAAAVATAQLHRKTSIPTPPNLYIAHPYTLLQLRDLVGRQAELNALKDWVANPGSPPFNAPIFCFVAIGGMGKSALTWKWFNQIAPNEMKALAGRMWWSFYESDATFENFLNRALCYVSRQSEEAVLALPWQEREAQLLRHLNDKPYLFVLDGLERVLIAYNRMDASNLADDEIDQQTANWVAGIAGLPKTAAQSFVGQHRLRQNTDPRAGAFLQKLAQLSKSRVLITTRLYPSELQLPTGFPRPGCSAYFLRGLSDDDAVGLWRALGVSGSRTELVPIFRSVETHPLLIQALASEVANYKRAPSDFARWRLDHPQFDPTSLPLVQSRNQILDYALRGLTTNVREVLQTLVGFRMPANYITLEALLVGTKKACRSAQQLDRALTELEDRGLIGWDREANRYDAHPIVRGVVWQLTDVKDRRGIYAALEAHFEPMTTPEWERVESLDDLTPAIERYHTLVGLGRYDDAFDLFRHALSDAAFFRLAAHRERTMWLEQLFPNGVSELPALSSGEKQAFALNALAQGCQFSGQPGKAVPLFKRAVKIREQIGDDKNRAVNISNLSFALVDIGALREAEINERHALILDHKIRGYHEGAVLQHYGQLLGLRGERALSHLTLNRSRRVFVEQRLRQWEGATSAYLAENAFLFSDFVKATAWADDAWELASHNRHERDFIRAALQQGRAAFGLGNLVRADERLHHALNRARVVNVVEFELPALVAIAELELKRGHAAQAKARLDDVWEAAERGPYPLAQSDAHNVLAAIALAENNKPAAIDAATKAYKAAWCDGPPYAYHWGLQKAKAHLAALGAPEPDMPPFDESKFEPLPEVEINPKDEYWVDPDKLD